jgi:hypothetical protein
MFLEALAEAVNAVSDWPEHNAMASDDPVNRLIGYRVGRTEWRFPLRRVKEEIPLLVAKRDQLKAITSKIRLPLRPYPEAQREREFLVRAALLTSAAHVTNSDMRRDTARWITFLGRLRAYPDGSFLLG